MQTASSFGKQRESTDIPFGSWKMQRSKKKQQTNLFFIMCRLLPIYFSLLIKKSTV